MKILSSLIETGAHLEPATTMSVHMTSLQEWITTTIIIIVMMQPTKMAPITNKMAQFMKTLPEPMQPMKTSPSIPKFLQ